MAKTRDGTVLAYDRHVHYIISKHLEEPGSNNDALHPEGFLYDGNLLNCVVGRVWLFEVPLFPQLNFQCVNDQLNEKQFLCFQCHRNKIKQTRSRYT